MVIFSVGSGISGRGLLYGADESTSSHARGSLSCSLASCDEQPHTMDAPNIDIMLKIVPFILHRKGSHIVRNPQLYILLQPYKQS